MARLTTGQKAQRVVRFLIGVRKPRVATALASHGFTQEALDEGWTLLRALAGEKLAVPALPSGPDPALVEQLDDWENKWFTIADATLTRHYPAVQEQVFLNLSRTSGPEVTVSVGTFLQRLEALENGSADEQAAHQLLVARGLTSEVVQAAKELLDAVGAIGDMALPIVDEAAIAAAEDAMWAWYLEWSAIAQLAIKDGRLLRALGYRSTRSGNSDEEPATELEDDGAIAVPMI